VPALIFRKGLDLKHEVASVLAESYHSALVNQIKAQDYRFVSGRLTIHLAREFGFCYGVDRAVDYAYQTIEKFPDRRVILTGEIIHNPGVNERLRSKGMPALRGGGHGDMVIELAVETPVNLSVRQLESPTLVSDVEEALGTAGLSPSLLVLEITENALMQRTESTLERLHELKQIGVRLAIDDFGTGYSSLSYLQQFPVDILKIDRSFTDGLMRGSHDDALARTIIALGDLLTLRTIAEGVEHARQHARLRDLGCDYGQGYLFSRPLAPADVDLLLRSGVLELPGEEPIVLTVGGAGGAAADALDDGDGAGPPPDL